MPTYNRASLIVTAIESILQQTYDHWELIVVDDGSTDDTSKVVDAYVRNDQRIRYYFQKNQGESVARNLGIQLAKGDFISFLDDDDYYYESFLESFKQVITKNGNFLQVLMCDQAEETVFGIRKREFDHTLFARDQLGYLILRGNNIQPFVFPKNILFEITFESKYQFGEDFHFLIRMLLQLPVIYVPKTLCVYRNHDQMTFSKELENAAFLNSEYNRLDMLDDLFDKFENNLLEKKVLDKLCNKYNKYCYFYAGAALNNQKTAVSWDFLKKMKWRYPNFIIVYYTLSILGRIPFYAFKNLIFKKFSSKAIKRSFY